MTFAIRRQLMRAAPAGALLALAALVSGCNSVGYYAQAVRGHCEIVSRQTSCKKLLASPGVSAPLKARLELARELRAFAEDELNLPAHGAYQRYADLQRPYVVWNVYAAPQHSMQARTWWYPFVGSLDYRGYFSERQARRYANRLAAQGWDVYVEGAEAYSTLGWFNDPLLNTFLHHSEPILAEILFHELAHQKVFAPGDTEFNEAFATVVAEEGVRRWLQCQQEHVQLQHYETAVARQRDFVRIVQSTRAELMTVYASSPESAKDESLERRKKQIQERLRREYAKLRAEWNDDPGYDPWFAGPLNNAQLNSVATYYDLVPAFSHLLATEAGDLNGFYTAVKQLTRLPKTERHAHLARTGESLAATQ